MSVAASAWVILLAQLQSGEQELFAHSLNLGTPAKPKALNQVQMAGKIKSKQGLWVKLEELALFSLQKEANMP